MLSFFRRALSSWLVLGLLGLLMIAFVVTGVGTPSSMGALGGVGSADVIRAGSRTLGVNEVSQRMQFELRQQRQQQPELTMTQFLQGGTLEKMIGEMGDLLSIRAFGEANGMAVSSRLTDGEIASIPAFQGATGKFDDARFRQALSQRGLTPEQFRADIDQGIAVRHILVPIAAGSGAARDMVAPYASLLVERRIGNAVEFRNSAFANGPAPTDAELIAFYGANKSRYIVPERRVIRYAVVDKAMVAQKSMPSEADVAAQYKADAAKYAARETRSLTQVIVQDQNMAKAIAQKAASGTKMADAAKAVGLDALTISAAEKKPFAEQSSDAVAAAAFAAAQGGVVGPIKSGLGWHVVKVDAVNKIGGKSLADVRGDIVAELQAQKAADAFANLLADIDDGVSNGQTFDDVVKARGLKVVSLPPLTASGLSPDQPGFKADAELMPVLKDAFQADPDDDPALVPTGPEKDVFYDLDRVIAAAPKPLAQIRDQVMRDFAADRASKAARKAAEDVLAKANAGATLAALKAGSIKPLSARRMDIVKEGKAPSVELQQLFDLPVGRARIAPSADRQGWIVVQLDKIEPGNIMAEPSLLAATQQQLSNAIGREYTQQFTAAAKKAINVKRNQAAINELRRSLAGSGGK
jgi:peptidyl-prolyl cis-trans isomerase D